MGNFPFPTPVTKQMQESVAAGLDAKVHDFSPTRSGRSLLGLSLGEWLAEQVRAGSRAVVGDATAELR